MNPTNYSLEANPVFTIEGTERWDVYHRLVELGIPCQCASHQSLIVKISSPNHLIQLWSIFKRINSSRHDLIMGLEDNWQIQLSR